MGDGWIIVASGKHSKRVPLPGRLMTGAEYIREKKRRRRNADHMRSQRSRCDALGQCRQCRSPVAVSKRTGKPAKLCRAHLAADWNRKLPYPLACERRGQLYYPLAWDGEIA